MKKILIGLILSVTGINFGLYSIFTSMRFCYTDNPCSLINWGAIGFLLGLDMIILGIIFIYHDDLNI